MDSDFIATHTHSTMLSMVQQSVPPEQLASYPLVLYLGAYVLFGHLIGCKSYSIRNSNKRACSNTLSHTPRTSLSADSVSFPHNFLLMEFHFYVVFIFLFVQFNGSKYGAG